MLLVQTSSLPKFVEAVLVVGDELRTGGRWISDVFGQRRRALCRLGFAGARTLRGWGSDAQSLITDHERRCVRAQGPARPEVPRAGLVTSHRGNSGEATTKPNLCCVSRGAARHRTPRHFVSVFGKAA